MGVFSLCVGGGGGLSHLKLFKQLYLLTPTSLHSKIAVQPPALPSQTSMLLVTQTSILVELKGLVSLLGTLYP